MTTQTDQIEEIKKAEENAKKQLEDTAASLRKEETTLKTKLEAEVEDRKKDLNERKQQKLEIAQQEADMLKKSRVTEAQSHKNQMISAAQSKQSEAADYIITKFVEHIKA